MVKKVSESLLKIFHTFLKELFKTPPGRKLITEYLSSVCLSKGKTQGI